MLALLCLATPPTVLVNGATGRTGSQLKNDVTPLKVLVTGATGRTGLQLYTQLKNDSRISEVRALVRGGADAKARAAAALGCTACDSSDGVYYGDVTAPATLAPAFQGVDTVAIAVGVGGGVNKTVEKAVEFIGVENQVAALMNGTSSSDPRVVLCSSMMTTDPKPLPFMGGSVLFWKLNAEAYIGYAGVGAVVVKPCGLTDGAKGEKELTVGHNDVVDISGGVITRSDVAAVMTEAVARRSRDLRFDLCVGKGAPTTDLGAVLESAREPWQ